MSKYSPCNDCGIDVETESCNTCEVDSLRKQVDSLRTRAESAEQKLVRFYSEHGIGWCGHHGYQGMKDEGESCPKCRAESAEEAFKAAEGEHAELWAERNGWQARAESAERERDEAYAKGLLRAAAIVEEEGLDNCSCVDGEKCESCYTVDDILERLKAERP